MTPIVSVSATLRVFSRTGASRINPICALTQMRFPEAGLATLSEPLTIEPIGIALAPGDSLLLNMVTNSFSALEDIGLLDALDKKWFKDGGWLIQLP